MNPVLLSVVCMSVNTSLFLSLSVFRLLSSPPFLSLGHMDARKVLNELHQYLAIEGFDEVDVETRGNDILIVTRHDPLTHRMCYFFIYTAFNSGVIDNPYDGGSLEVKGQVDKVVLEARLAVDKHAAFANDSDFINGLPSSCDVSACHSSIHSTLGFFESSYDSVGDMTRVVVKKAFVPGSVFVLLTKGYASVRAEIETAISVSLPERVLRGRKERVDELLAYNYLLYSCASEELDRSKGQRGCYAFP